MSPGGRSVVKRADTARAVSVAVLIERQRAFDLGLDDFPNSQRLVAIHRYR